MPTTPPRINLWAVDLDRWAATGPDASTVTERDRSQAGRIRSAGGGARLLARRSATRTVLAEVLGVDAGDLGIERACPTCGSIEHGRPSVVGASVAFSVSSSDGLAVVAVAEGPVGVDLEVAHGHSPPQPAALTVRERAGVAALAPGRQEVGFLRLWTAKEAVLKASGRSLADDPATIEVVGLLDGDVVEVVDGRRTWTVRHLAFDAPTSDPAVLAVANIGGGQVVWRSLT